MLLVLLSFVHFFQARAIREGKTAQKTFMVDRQVNIEMKSNLPILSQTSRNTQEIDNSIPSAENVTGLFNQRVSEKKSLTFFEIILSDVLQPLPLASLDALMEKIDYLIYESSLNRTWYKDTVQATGRRVSLSFESHILNQTVISTRVGENEPNDIMPSSSNDNNAFQTRKTLLYLQVAEEATVTLIASNSPSLESAIIPSTNDFRAAVKQAFNSAEKLDVTRQELSKEFPEHFSNLEEIKFNRFLNSSNDETMYEGSKLSYGYDSISPNWSLILGMFFFGVFVIALFVCSLFGLSPRKTHKHTKVDEDLSERLSQQTTLRAVRALEEYNSALSEYKDALVEFQSTDSDDSEYSFNLERLTHQHAYVTCLFEEASELWEVLGKSFPINYDSTKAKSKPLFTTT